MEQTSISLLLLLFIGISCIQFGALLLSYITGKLVSEPEKTFSYIVTVVLVFGTIVAVSSTALETSLDFAVIVVSAAVLVTTVLPITILSIIGYVYSERPGIYQIGRSGFATFLSNSLITGVIIVHTYLSANEYLRINVSLEPLEIVLLYIIIHYILILYLFKRTY